MRDMSLSAQDEPTAKERDEAKQRQRMIQGKPDLIRLKQARAALSGLSGTDVGFPTSSVTPGRQSVPLGPPEVDGHLPGGGMIANALHEVLPNDPRDTPAATSFLGHLAARLLNERSGSHRGGGVTVWIRPQGILREWGMPYGPGLGELGLNPARLLFIHPRSDQDTLWAIEEAVQAKGVGVVIGEVETRALNLTASRRIHLAAEKVGTPVLLARGHNCLGSTAALTRWQISARPSAPPEYSETGLGSRRWKADLSRAKGGRPGNFELEWDHATHCFSLATALAHGQISSRLKAANAA